MYILYVRMHYSMYVHTCGLTYLCEGSCLCTVCATVASIAFETTYLVLNRCVVAYPLCMPAVAVEGVCGNTTETTGDLCSCNTGQIPGKSVSFVLKLPCMCELMANPQYL